MTKRALDMIMAGISDMKAIEAGTADPATYRVHVPEKVDVKAIRTRLGLSQAAFSQRFGFPLGTLQDWEQSRRAPEASARVLLTVIEREPEAVQRALALA